MQSVFFSSLLVFEYGGASTPERFSIDGSTRLD